MFTLHKLPEGFIITSNEEVQKDDYYIAWETNYATEPKKRWVLYNLGSGLNGSNQQKVIAQQDQIEFSALSEEEQKKIRYFNVEKMARQWVYRNTDLPSTSEEAWYEKVYISGFQKAQELLYDRMFTLEDMKLCYMQGWNRGRDGHSTEMNNYIQSLSQPKSWKIELEMEQTHWKGTKLSYEDRFKPKLTNGKVKILKLL